MMMTFQVDDDVDVNQAGEHVASKGTTFLPMERTLFHIDQVGNIPKWQGGIVWRSDQEKSNSVRKLIFLCFQSVMFCEWKHLEADHFLANEV